MDSLTNDFGKLLKHAPKEEVLGAIEDAKYARDTAKNSTNSSPSKANRLMMRLPPTVVHWISIKYGKNIWRNKKFVKELFDTYKVFRACEKY